MRRHGLRGSGSVRRPTLSFPRENAATTSFGAIPLETHGPLGTLWVGLGLCAFYIALVWINTLLGFLLTPLFTLPATRLMDTLNNRKARKRE